MPLQALAEWNKTANNARKYTQLIVDGDEVCGAGPSKCIAVAAGEMNRRWATGEWPVRKLNSMLVTFSGHGCHETRGSRKKKQSNTPHEQDRLEPGSQVEIVHLQAFRGGPSHKPHTASISMGPMASPRCRQQSMTASHAGLGEMRRDLVNGWIGRCELGRFMHRHGWIRAKTRV